MSFITDYFNKILSGSEVSTSTKLNFENIPLEEYPEAQLTDPKHSTNYKRTSSNQNNKER